MQNLVAVVLESVLHLRREMPISNKLHQNGTTKSSKKRIATSSHDSRKCYQPETWTRKDMSWTSDPHHLSNIWCLDMLGIMSIPIHAWCIRVAELGKQVFGLGLGTFDFNLRIGNLSFNSFQILLQPLLVCLKQKQTQTLTCMPWRHTFYTNTFSWQDEENNAKRRCHTTREHKRCNCKPTWDSSSDCCRDSCSFSCERCKLSSCFHAGPHSANLWWYSEIKTCIGLISWGRWDYKIIYRMDLNPSGSSIFSGSALVSSKSIFRGCFFGPSGLPLPPSPLPRLAAPTPSVHCTCSNNNNSEQKKEEEEEEEEEREKTLKWKEFS